MCVARRTGRGRGGLVGIGRLGSGSLLARGAGHGDMRPIEKGPGGPTQGGTEQTRKPMAHWPRRSGAHRPKSAIFPASWYQQRTKRHAKWTTTKTESKPEREKQLGVPSPERRSEERSKARESNTGTKCKGSAGPHGAEERKTNAWGTNDALSVTVTLRYSITPARLRARTSKDVLNFESDNERVSGEALCRCSGACL